MTETETVSYRHEVSPAIALNLLDDLRQSVTQHQQQLRQVVSQIRALYAEGPVVNGWLESLTASSAQHSSTQALFRHGDAETLMAYLQSLEAAAEKAPETEAVPSAAEVSQYRLCQLDAAGQVRSQRCPPEQVAAVSLAIVRHQRLRQLVERKQAIEAKLKQVVDTLGSLKTLLS